MSVPNLEQDVRIERAKYPEPLLTADQCGAICNAVAWKHRATGWGVNGKDFGNHAIRHDGTAIAVDILHHQPSNHLIDCLSAAGDRVTGEKGPAAATWIDHGPNPHGNRPWIAPIPPQGDQPVTGTCALGVSWFGALGLYKHDRPKFDDTLRFHRDILKPDYARVFWYLAGGPWGLVGTGEVSDSARRALLVAVIESLLNANIKPQVTVFGTWVPDNGRRLDLVQQFRDTVQRYAASLFAVDCFNEPGAIGVPEYGHVREVGRMLTGLHVPLLSLASPNSLHMGVDGRRATDAEVLADARKLYGDMPAEINCITPHWGRAPWEPHRNLGLPHLKQINDEPRGYQSSVSEISLPLHFAQDYEASARAGDVGYTLHGEPGVWDGYCDTRGHPEWARHNDVRRWQDVPQIGEIVDLLHKVRAGQSLPGGGGGGTEEPEMPLPTYEDLGGDARGAEVGRALFADYARAGADPDPGMGIWFNRTIYDFIARIVPTAEASVAKHQSEWRAELERAVGHPINWG